MNKYDLMQISKLIYELNLKHRAITISKKGVTRGVTERVLPGVCGVY